MRRKGIGYRRLKKFAQAAHAHARRQHSSQGEHSTREWKRAAHRPGGAFYERRGERQAAKRLRPKYGRRIRRNEMPKIGEELADQMKLSGRVREQFMEKFTNPRRRDKLMRQVEQEMVREVKKEYGDDISVEDVEAADEVPESASDGASFAEQVFLQAAKNRSHDGSPAEEESGSRNQHSGEARPRDGGENIESLRSALHEPTSEESDSQNQRHAEDDRAT